MNDDELRSIRLAAMYDAVAAERASVRRQKREMLRVRLMAAAALLAIITILLLAAFSLAPKAT